MEKKTKMNQPPRVKIPLPQALGMILPYIRTRFLDQVKSVWLIVVYLILFQILILGIPVAEAGVISFGIAFVILGLTFFMEGLMLGLMPLGEIIGTQLPKKSKLPVILTFAFILGVGVTFAEPAVGILKTAGASVMAWNAPLLYLILNRMSGMLVWAVGIGVGIAVVLGMMRFIFNWSLKPYIYIILVVLIPLSVWGLFEPNILYLLGLAWDCGGVTTGPVTVPLVLALGIGISRIVSKDNSGGGGFGVVTLASALPVFTVTMLGVLFLGSVPKPSDPAAFFSPAQRDKAAFVFRSSNEMNGYALQNSGESAWNVLFGSRSNAVNWIGGLKGNIAAQKEAFGSTDAFDTWMGSSAPRDILETVYPGAEGGELAKRVTAIPALRVDGLDVLIRNTLAAAQSIVPLIIFLLLVLLIVLRERLPRTDEIFFGIFIGLIGMSLFYMGIELGLTRLGNQVGVKLPATFKAISLTEQKTLIPNFDSNLVQTSIALDGTKSFFFFKKEKNENRQIPFETQNYSSTNKQYLYVPKIGPLFGKEGGFAGILVVLLFAFFMGYGATMAEPALNALGIKVEELTVGTFKKSLLMQAVAIGVGVGILLGLVKIVFNIPLPLLLIPPYLLLVPITILSTDEFVNIGWDSAGVTTGPITVPLVLAMGLGIGGQVGVVEGFGILSMASVMPILSVLCVGLVVNRKRKSEKAAAGSETKKA